MTASLRGPGTKKARFCLDPKEGAWGNGVRGEDGTLSSTCARPNSLAILALKHGEPISTARRGGLVPGQSLRHHKEALKQVQITFMPPERVA